MTELIDAWSAASDDMHAAFREVRAERDAAREEAADLRRQLAEIATALGLAPSDDWLEVAGAAGNLVVQLEIAADELTDLRRQLAECQASASKFMRAENQRLRRGVQLYESDLSAAEDTNAALRRQLAEAQAQLAQRVRIVERREPGPLITPEDFGYQPDE